MSFFSIGLKRIRWSVGGFILLLVVSLLGSTITTAILSARPTIITSTADYSADHNLYSYRLSSSAGFTEAQVLALSGSGATVEGSYETQATMTCDSGISRSLMVHSIPETVNTITLIAGRMPENDHECLVDYSSFEPEEVSEYLTVAEETAGILASDSYHIVGLCQSPIYMGSDRAGTDGFIYVLPEGFSAANYTTVYAVVDDGSAAFTEDYDNAVIEQQDSWQTALDNLAYATADSGVEAPVIDETAEEQPGETTEADSATDTAAQSGLSEPDAASAKDAFASTSSASNNSDNLSAAQDNLEKMAAKLATSKANIDSYEAKKVELNNSIASVTAQIQQLTAAGQTSSANYQYLKEQYAALNTELANLETTLSVAKREYADYQTQYEARKKQLANTSSDTVTKSENDEDTEVTDIVVSDTEPETETEAALSVVSTELDTILDNGGYQEFEVYCSNMSLWGLLAAVISIVILVLATGLTIVDMSKKQRKRNRKLVDRGVSALDIRLSYAVFATLAIVPALVVGIIIGRVGGLPLIWELFQQQFTTVDFTAL